MLGVSCRLRLLIRTRHLLFDGRLRYRARLFAVFDKSGQLHSVAHGYAHIPGISISHSPGYNEKSGDALVTLLVTIGLRK
ncbi:hypothetical protein NDU88_004159 [Pleurodeles waltl]|uniref:Uncharacterized protein n=1 Tax=Pleurodeles waltl TaxID=8319 RepID=A0AAV7L139_PLEWA|nr:hypothetical protein NDU88_004159 [Pleurodeles waltl]